MQKTVGEIAQSIDGQVVGDETIVIKGISGIKEASENDLTFLANSKYLPLANQTKASAIIVDQQMTVEGKTVIQVANPSLAFAQAVDIFISHGHQKCKGVHATAVIGENVVLGDGVGIGPHVVVEDNVTIGDETIIMAGSYIGSDSQLGKQCLIYPNVTIRERSQIGQRVIIHSGSVIGSDGYGYATIDGKHLKIPQVGMVVIGDDVEIGACVTVDRARFDKTVIGRGTKIDNLVQIAHNVHVGEDCLIVAQAGISGSTVLENSVVMAGQVGIAGHLRIGKGAVLAAKAGVTKSVPEGAMYGGYPARDFKDTRKVEAHLGRLPQYAATIKALTQRIEALEDQLSSS